MRAMSMLPYMERGCTCSILCICGDHPLSELAYLACGRGPHVRDKVPMKGLGSWWCTFVLIAYLYLLWLDMDSGWSRNKRKKSTVGARECVSLLCMMFSNGKGCIAWSTSVHICWSIMLWNIVAMMMKWFFLFFVHAYISYFFRHRTHSY